MPSRQLATSAIPLNNHRVETPLSASTASLCSLFFLLFLCLRKRKRKGKRTTPSSDSDSNPPHPYTYSLLRRATNSFSTRLGHGGFGPVFSGTLAGDPIAVKLMDAASLQGEREFHNELFFASRLRSHLVVPAIGFSSDPKRRRFLLVYHLMHNGNLHDALLRNKTPHLALWKNRFNIILDVAKGIQYLHSLDPPIIHGDIKPSNILLDDNFSAKIADFGLARLKSDVEEFKVTYEERKKEESESDAGSELETQSVNTEQSFEEKNEYVMDWIGKEVKNGSVSTSVGTVEKKKNDKKSKKKLEWWESMDDNGVLKKEKRKAAREWWKEEYSQELARKKKKKKKKGKDRKLEIDDVYSDVNVYKREKNRSRNSGGSVDSWLSGEIFRARWNSYDSGTNSGEIVVGKSGGVSSTQSMRGTVFYVAPEYGYNGDVSEKCDVYSFGVLLLVIVSGRRPLQVTGSPISEFKRANLVSWARQCARRGKLLEVVDESVEGLDKEEASLCVTVALMCLLKSPARRPSMKEVVGMLSGEFERPKLPVEYQQHSRFPFKSQKETK